MGIACVECRPSSVTSTACTGQPVQASCKGLAFATLGAGGGHIPSANQILHKSCHTSGLKNLAANTNLGERTMTLSRNIIQYVLAKKNVATDLHMQ
jgi:hypothetical protein